MKNSSRQFMAGLVLTITTSVAQAELSGMPAGLYEVDPQHAYVNFSYTHLGFSRPVVGFNDFTVELELEPEEIAKSRISVDIDPASIDSRVDEFNGHLVGEDFFDVENHPEIRFVATAIEMTGANTANITGDLTIKGITKPVVLDAAINKAGTHPMNKKPTIGISATGVLMRSEWDLGRYVPAVSDEVELNLQLELSHNTSG